MQNLQLSDQFDGLASKSLRYLSFPLAKHAFYLVFPKSVVFEWLRSLKWVHGRRENVVQAIFSWKYVHHHTISTNMLFLAQELMVNVPWLPARNGRLTRRVHRPMGIAIKYIYLVRSPKNIARNLLTNVSKTKSNVTFGIERSSSIQHAISHEGNPGWTIYRLQLVVVVHDSR